LTHSLSFSKKTLRKAEGYLSENCAVMRGLIALHGACPLAEQPYQPFQTLVSSIIGQQLSSKAAGTIKQRVRGLAPGFTSAGFLALTVDALRSAGLSLPKARYILELARRVGDGRLDFAALRHTPDEEVIAALVELPGIGRWTAEMFLIFGLHRADVLSLGDAGLRRAVRLLFGEEAKLEIAGQAWHPYCSIASWYLWRHLDFQSARSK
jgi:DNA-3-methyladenine glycosylase II